MKCFYQYYVFDPPGQNGGWSRQAKRKPSRHLKEGWCDLPEPKWGTTSGGFGTLNLNGRTRKKYNLIFENGQYQVDYSDCVPEWWDDPLAVAAKFAELNVEIEKGNHLWQQQ